MRKKNIKCIITKECIDGRLDDFELVNTKDVIDIIPLFSEFDYFMLINQDNGSDLTENPITIVKNNLSLQVIVEDLIFNKDCLFDTNLETQTIRIYCFLNYSKMSNFLDLIYH